MQVLVSLVVLVGLTILVDGSLLLRDPKQNCMAHGNGTVYDISVLFLNGPITIDTGTLSLTILCCGLSIRCLVCFVATVTVANGLLLTE